MREVALAIRLTGLNESATLALNAKAKLMAASGKTIYNLTAGELATYTPEYIQTAVIKKLSQNKYTAVAGLMELRESIAQHAVNFYGLSWIKSDNVVVTSGAKPALYAALLSLVNAGDEVILPVPAWTTSYRPLIELCGGKVVEVPLSQNFDLDVSAIQAKISDKTKAIIINSPNNPTGAIFSKAKLTKLAAALKSSQITVIADDIYSKLVYEPDFTLVPTCGFENLIIINGFSKSQALTGWRIGYLIASQPIAKAATSLLSHITGNASLPGQYAALEALRHKDLPPVSTIASLKAQRSAVIEALNSVGIKHNTPGGAFYIFLDLRQLTADSATWCQRLLDKYGVALVPGEAFSAPGFARLTFVQDVDTLKRAIGAIDEFIKGGS